MSATGDSCDNLTIDFTNTPTTPEQVAACLAILTAYSTLDLAPMLGLTTEGTS